MQNQNSSARRVSLYFIEPEFLIN